MALDPFLGNGRDGDASQRFVTFEVDGEDRLGDALALELCWVEIDEEELLMALKLEFTRAAIVAFDFFDVG